jgi:hypothetical protein
MAGKFSRVPARNNENMAGIERTNVHDGDRILIPGNHTRFEFARNDSTEDTAVAHCKSFVLLNVRDDPPEDKLGLSPELAKRAKTAPAGPPWVL